LSVRPTHDSSRFLFAITNAAMPPPIASAVDKIIFVTARPMGLAPHPQCEPSFTAKSALPFGTLLTFSLYLFTLGVL
jgi:hypothetical protein